MGRHKKDKGKTAQQNNSDFSVDKSEQLKKFNVDEKKVLSTLTKEIIAKFDILPVRNPSKLSGRKIFACVEKNYEESLKRAYAIRDEHNAKYKDNPMVLVDYYPQEFGHKAILVSCNYKSENNLDEV
jgi:hypothetical protein